jgi:hemerythrin-like domain-containing protein
LRVIARDLSGGRRFVAKKMARKQSTGRRSAGKRAASRSAVAKRTTKRASATAARRQTKAAKRKTAARSAAARSSRKRPTPKASSRAAATATAIRGALAGAVAAVSSRLPGASAVTDAITLLETDHRRFEDLLAQGEETTERAVKGRTELLGTITAELTVHELIEEKVLYPALKAHPEARDIVLEGFQEHHVADLIVRELQNLAPNDERWGAKFKVLKENIEHHIDEEEGPMFRTARGVFSREQLQEMGAQMAAMKADAERGRP